MTKQAVASLVWPGRESLPRRRDATYSEEEAMASVWTALLIEAGAAFVVSGSLSVWARKRFTPRQAADVAEQPAAA